ncbi:MAG: sulfurtransferase [Actinomycetales bacterium]
MSILITAAALKEQLDAGKRVVLLDVRWALGDPEGHAKYRAAHIPGAVYVDLATELAGPGDARDGRHPLPGPAAFGESARRWGISAGDTVVAYDDSANMAASRLWWLLRHAGHERIQLLDGGLRAWTGAGNATDRGEEQPCLGDVRLGWGAMGTISTDDAGAWPGRGVLLDARAGERYRGETEPIDPKAGHIPGAVSAPTAENVDPDGHFLDPALLRGRFAALGVSEAAETAVYCGSGVTAAHEIAALEIAGYHARLYPGSFSAWANHAELPVAVGG